MTETTQRMLKGSGPLLNPDGSLADIGWATQPVLDCNLEKVGFYKLRFLQPLRVKRWDYYGITTPTHFFSFTISHVGYLASIFAYVVEFETQKYHEETLTIPLGGGVILPRNSTQGESLFDNGKVRLHFWNEPGTRHLEVRWAGFDGADLTAQASFALPEEHESMVIVIPIPGKRFYYNRKVNCMPASGQVEYRGQRHTLDPATCLGNLDWGRGVWEYRSFWVWSSASGFLPGGHTIGLNMGYGFGDISAATENAFILDGRVHKLARLDYDYDPQNFMRAWTMHDPGGRLDLTFTPFLERVAKLDLGILASEVHQMFGRYDGRLVTDGGKSIEVRNLVGWSEEHKAKW